MLLSYNVNDVIVLCGKIPVVSFAEDRKIEIEAEAEYYSYKQDNTGEHNFLVMNNNNNYNVKIPLLKGSPSNIFFSTQMKPGASFDIIMLNANLKLEFAGFFYAKDCVIIKPPSISYTQEVPVVEWEIKAFNANLIIGK